MSRYILIQSKSPWESGDVDHFYLALILTSSWAIVRFPSDTTSPKVDISTWPEADIFTWPLGRKGV